MSRNGTRHGRRSDRRAGRQRGAEEDRWRIWARRERLQRHRAVGAGDEPAAVLGLAERTEDGGHASRRVGHRSHGASMPRRQQARRASRSGRRARPFGLVEAAQLVARQPPELRGAEQHRRHGEGRRAAEGVAPHEAPTCRRRTGEERGRERPATAPRVAPALRSARAATARITAQSTAAPRPPSPPRTDLVIPVHRQRKGPERREQERAGHGEGSRVPGLHGARSRIAARACSGGRGRPAVDQERLPTSEAGPEVPSRPRQRNRRPRARAGLAHPAARGPARRRRTGRPRTAGARARARRSRPAGRSGGLGPREHLLDARDEADHEEDDRLAALGDHLRERRRTGRA